MVLYQYQGFLCVFVSQWLILFKSQRSPRLRGELKTKGRGRVRRGRKILRISEESAGAPGQGKPLATAASAASGASGAIKEADGDCASHGMPIPSEVDFITGF